MKPQLARSGGSLRAESLFGTSFHADGTVTVWDVYQQRWTRTAVVPDRVLASLDEGERMRVIRHVRGWTPDFWGWDEV